MNPAIYFLDGQINLLIIYLKGKNTPHQIQDVHSEGSPHAT